MKCDNCGLTVSEIRPDAPRLFPFRFTQAELSAASWKVKNFNKIKNLT